MRIEDCSENNEGIEMMKLAAFVLNKIQETHPKANGLVLSFTNDEYFGIVSYQISAMDSLKLTHSLFTALPDQLKAAFLKEIAKTVDLEKLI